MGLLGPVERRESLGDLVGEAFEVLMMAGIARREVEALAGSKARDVVGIVARVADALETSPHPETEWDAVTARLGDELVVRLCQVSPSSLARYASGARVTPDPVAHRLHHLALVVADLAGSCNERGMRRWFDRPRPQLAGATPASLLTKGWDPDDPGPQRMAELAAALAGAGGILAVALPSAVART